MKLNIFTKYGLDLRNLTMSTADHVIFFKRFCSPIHSATLLTIYHTSSMTIAG